LNDYRSGQGTEESAAGKYVGEWKLNKKDGEGKEYDKYGKLLHEGTWSNDRWMYHYTGEMRDGKRHGKGINNDADGTYDGEWANDYRNGSGVFTANSGVVYDGQWLSGRKNGKGKISGGDYSYDGDWISDSKSGSGKMTDQYGTYIGEWKGDKRHGKGAITWLTGETYEGDWSYDHMEGDGTFTWPEGKQPEAMKNVTKYTGSFSNDMFNGYGKCYNSSGRLVKKGYWSSNKFYGRKKPK
jgi:hypothetical protein